jgi:pimeloyl-ACP methyl ester carboxylesterase
MGWMKDGKLFPTEGGERKSENAIVACIRGFKGLAVSAEEVRGIKTPFIVLIGDSDPLRQQFVEPLRALRPDVPVKVIEGAGHLDCIFKPAFKEAIKTFLDSPPAKPGAATPTP